MSDYYLNKAGVKLLKEQLQALVAAVTGVKGNAESSYRTGNVNITPADIGVEDGAEVNVQSDWNVTNTSSDAYIKNKPTIGDATLTIQKNGTTVQTFTANATNNKTANISVPEKTSEITDDCIFPYRGEIATGNDYETYDDAIDQGSYYVRNGVSGYPGNSSNYYRVLVFKVNGAIFQLAFVNSAASDNTFWRVRYTSGPTWSTWRQIFSGHFGTASDLDDCLQNGVYYASATTSNKPASAECTVFAFSGNYTNAPTNGVVQVAVDNSTSNYMYFRHRRNSTWNTWSTIATTAYVEENAYIHRGTLPTNTNLDNVKGAGYFGMWYLPNTNTYTNVPDDMVGTANAYLEVMEYGRSADMSLQRITNTGQSFQRIVGASTAYDWFEITNDTSLDTYNTSSDVSVANNTVVNVGSLTVGRGTFIFKGTASFSNDDTGYRQIGIATSATSGYESRNSVVRVLAASGANTFVQVTAFLRNTSNSKTYYLNVRQNSGSTLTASAGFQVVHIGGTK